MSNMVPRPDILGALRKGNVKRKSILQVQKTKMKTQLVRPLQQNIYNASNNKIVEARIPSDFDQF